MANPRALVTREELLAYLNAKLQKIEDCEGCSFSTITLLQEPDEGGCNWSSDLSIRSGGDVSADYVNPYARRVVEEARKRFNLRDE